MGEVGELNEEQRRRATGKRWWSPFVTFAVLVAAIVALLNGVPQFIDETLPWLSGHINIGPIDSTVWDVVWASVAAAAGAVSATGRSLLNRRVQALQEESRHRLVEIRFDVSKCACGWLGLHGDFERHPQAPETDMRSQVEESRSQR